MEQSPGFQISLSFLRLISTSNGTRCCFLFTHQFGSPSPRPLGPGNVPPAGWCPRALHLPGENKGWRRWWVLRAKYLGEEFHTGWGHLGGNLVMLRLRLCFASCSLFGPVHYGYSRVTVRLEGEKGLPPWLLCGLASWGHLPAMLLCQSADSPSWGSGHGQSVVSTLVPADSSWQQRAEPPFAPRGQGSSCRLRDPGLLTKIEKSQ